MDAMDDRIAINEKNVDMTDRIPLARVSPHNYLEYLKAGALENDIKRAKVQSVKGLK
jgi:hypothetical protein